MKINPRPIIFILIVASIFFIAGCVDTGLFAINQPGKEKKDKGIEDIERISSDFTNIQITQAMTGESKFLTILVGFPDQYPIDNIGWFYKPYLPAYATEDYFYNFMFSPSDKKTYRNWLLQNSYGNLNLSGRVIKVVAPHNFTYYCIPDLTGVCTGPYGPGGVISDVIKMIDPEINFHDFDGNNDNKIDGIFFVFPPRTIWLTKRSPFFLGEGLFFNFYSPYTIPGYMDGMSAAYLALDLNDISGLDDPPNYPDIFWFYLTHEGGHVFLDLGDLYDTLTGRNGEDKYDVMSRGRGHFSIYTKTYLNYVTPRVINVGENQTIRLYRSQEAYSYTTNLKALKIFRNNSNLRKYFMAELRYSGLLLGDFNFDSEAGIGNGIAIYEIEESTDGSHWTTYIQLAGHRKLSLGLNYTSKEGIVIEPISQTTEYADVKITYTGIRKGNISLAINDMGIGRDAGNNVIKADFPAVLYGTGALISDDVADWFKINNIPAGIPITITLNQTAWGTPEIADFNLHLWKNVSGGTISVASSTNGGSTPDKIDYITSAGSYLYIQIDKVTSQGVYNLGIDLGGFTTTSVPASTTSTTSTTSTSTTSSTIFTSTSSTSTSSTTTSTSTSILTTTSTTTVASTSSTTTSTSSTSTTTEQILTTTMLGDTKLPTTTSIVYEPSPVIKPGTLFGNDATAGTILWDNPGNLIADDGLLTMATVSNGQRTQFVIAKGFNFNIPPGATINGIAIRSKGRMTILSGSSGQNYQIWKIIKNGVISTAGPLESTGGFFTGSIGYISRGGATSLWGKTWAPADINSPEFGIAFQGATSLGDYTLEYALDFVEITVYYTPPPDPQLFSLVNAINSIFSIGTAGGDGGGVVVSGGSSGGSVIVPVQTYQNGTVIAQAADTTPNLAFIIIVIIILVYLARKKGRR